VPWNASGDPLDQEDDEQDENDSDQNPGDIAGHDNPFAVAVVSAEHFPTRAS
jgi:hypothetical protein